MSASVLMVQDYAGVTVATITSSAMLDARAIDDTGAALFKLVDAENRRKLIVDFSDVKFLSSQAIGVVLTLHKKCKGIKGELVLCGVRDPIMEVFKITKLNKLLTFLADEKAALKKFGIHVS